MRDHDGKRTLHRIDDLVAEGLILGADQPALEAVAQTYAVAVTPDMADLIATDDLADPIAAQFIPTAQELDLRPDERADPIGDKAHSPVPGLVHRYPDRVLLKAASTCPVYCRFCFRREMVGPDKGDALTSADIDRAIAYIAARPEIWEVILTGGDPLVLSARRINDLSVRLAAIPHVQVLRWHSRVPVVAPALLTPERIAALAGPCDAETAQVYVAVHANHAREFTLEARAVCRRLARAGITLVSQSVLLRGVNDSVAALSELMRKFVATGIKPYYLHQLDRAPGTSHFRVPLSEAKALVSALRGHLSGLCQPTFVIDIPGGHGKIVAGDSDVGPVEDHDDDRNSDTPGPQHVMLRDRHGRQHRYEG